MIQNNLDSERDQNTRDKSIEDALEPLRECCKQGFCGTDKCPGCGNDKEKTNRDK